MPSASGSGSSPLGPESEVLERLTEHLCTAALRLVVLRRHIDRPADQLMLIQASEDLDEAISEIRRLAITARIAPEGR